MGLFDFWKKDPAKTPETAAEQPADSLETPCEAGEETVEQIVGEVAAEIQAETGESVPEPVVEEVVTRVKAIEESVAQDLKNPPAEPASQEARTLDGGAAAEDAADETQEPNPDAETDMDNAQTSDFGAETVMPQPEKKGFFARLKAGLGKTRDNILGSIDGVLGGFTSIDEDLFEELEEALIMADLGFETTMRIIENLRAAVKRERMTDPQGVKGLLVREITEILEQGTETGQSLESPAVLLVIGVNGVGKTTTIGKLSHLLQAEGKSVLLAAADTFRAAAIDQLEVWGERNGISVIKHGENSDPAAVVFDAAHAAKNRGCDVLICDTAGRLHNKKNLMEELRKIDKVIGREYPEAHKDVYLVLDATTGQNALQQAKLFREVADITGIILTKLDGTAKGGIVVAIKAELGIPVRYIGVGEGIEDLQAFDAKAFAEALFQG